MFHILTEMKIVHIDFNGLLGCNCCCLFVMHCVLYISILLWTLVFGTGEVLLMIGKKLYEAAYKIENLVRVLFDDVQQLVETISRWLFSLQACFDT